MEREIFVGMPVAHTQVGPHTDMNIMKNKGVVTQNMLIVEIATAFEDVVFLLGLSVDFLFRHQMIP